MVLSNRLKAIVQMVPKALTVADIGCDHGKVAAALMQNGMAQNIICADISASSLDKAKKLLYAEKPGCRVSFREGSGLDVLAAGEADVAVIAGMGGELIVSILDAGKDRAPDTLILSCNTAPDILRRWLCGNGYRFEDEALVYENGHFYPVMRVKKGQCGALSETELEFGPVLLQKKPETLKRLVNSRIGSLTANRESIKKYGSPEARALLSRIDKKLEEYAEVEKCL